MTCEVFIMKAITTTDLSLNEKLNILADAAKYDVACTSSGVSRSGKKGSLGNSYAPGICHSFAADGRCISLLKILQSNECVYDCKYCQNRSSNDVQRATFTPDEICNLVVEFYKRNYIEGLFLSSGVVRNPTHTMELMYRTIYLLRNTYHFNGYIHIKAIPNAPEELITQIGYLTDRMSINLELPTDEGLKTLAPHKSQASILRPMRRIQDNIADYRQYQGKSRLMERSSGNRLLSGTIFDDAKRIREDSTYPRPFTFSPPSIKERPRSFVPAGQSTQMIIGATGENDYQLLTVTEQLYQQYDLKRVFFSAYIPLNEDALLPSIDSKPPLLREHRLYQADWLLRYYGFHSGELLSPEKPNFNIYIDPKCDWALRHLEIFPVEANIADYATLLKVPGIGPKSAMRIITARESSRLDFDSLKRIGVVLKRAKYFLTCMGKMMYHIRIDEDFITRQLIGEDQKLSYQVEHPTTYRQLSLFDVKG